MAHDGFHPYPVITSDTAKSVLPSPLLFRKATELMPAHLEHQRERGGGRGGGAGGPRSERRAADVVIEVVAAQGLEADVIISQCVYTYSNKRVHVLWMVFQTGVIVFLSTTEAPCLVQRPYKRSGRDGSGCAESHMLSCRMKILRVSRTRKFPPERACGHCFGERRRESKNLTTGLHVLASVESVPVSLAKSSPVPRGAIYVRVVPLMSSPGACEKLNPVSHHGKFRQQYPRQ